MRALIVEDEKKLAVHLGRSLQSEGFEVELLHEGKEAFERIQTGHFDVVVLDIMLPGQDGLSILQAMRAHGNNTPALVISARGHVTDKIKGLDLGADDYLAKPFVLAEVVARVRALTRRRPEPKLETLRVADLTLDPVTRTAQRGKERIELATREYKLLEFLMRSKGVVCGRMTIIEKVWDYHFDPGTNLVDVYIMRLREKIDANHALKLLHTVKGIGYVIREDA